MYLVLITMPFSWESAPPIQIFLVLLSKKYRKFIIADTRPKYACYFKNVTLLSPNYKEAIEIAKIQDLEKAGKIIQKQLNCNVLITQGSQGMTLFENNEVRYFSTKAKEVFELIIKMAWRTANREWYLAID